MAQRISAAAPPASNWSPGKSFPVHKLPANLFGMIGTTLSPRDGLALSLVNKACKLSFSPILKQLKGELKKEIASLFDYLSKKYVDFEDEVLKDELMAVIDQITLKNYSEQQDIIRRKLFHVLLSLSEWESIPVFEVGLQHLKKMVETILATIDFVRTTEEDQSGEERLLANFALHKLVIILCKQKLSDEAMPLLEMIDDSTRKGKASETIVKAICVQGRLEEANAMARAIEEGASNAEAMQAVSLAYCAQKSYVQAIATAHSISRQFMQRDASLNAIMAALTKEGRLDEALRVKTYLTDY